MSLTDEQKAFRLRKLRTFFAAQDVDNDGYLTTEDFKLMAKRLIEYGKFIEYDKLDEKKEQEITKVFLDGCNSLGLNEGEKMTLDEFLIHSVKLSESPGGPELTRKIMVMNFDMVDINGDGVISPKEFRQYFKCMGLNESHAKASFDAIDTNHDGFISKEEFLEAAVEFFHGFDPLSGGTVFVGPLVD